MTTARDLLWVFLSVEHNRSMEQGDLSLALAGAEMIDLLDAGAVALEGENIVPGDRLTTGDRLLDEAATSVVRQVPYETVGDWLWRRGRGLLSAYLAALEEDGQLTRQRQGRTLLGTSRMVPVDSAAHRLAMDRWTANEPVLRALTGAVRLDDTENEQAVSVTDDAVVTVLVAVNDALLELEAVRQRRDIEEAAFDNVWRG